MVGRKTTAILIALVLVAIMAFFVLQSTNSPSLNKQQTIVFGDFSAQKTITVQNQLHTEQIVFENASEPFVLITSIPKKLAPKIDQVNFVTKNSISILQADPLILFSPKEASGLNVTIRIESTSTQYATFNVFLPQVFLDSLNPTEKQQLFDKINESADLNLSIDQINELENKTNADLVQLFGTKAQAAPSFLTIVNSITGFSLITDVLSTFDKEYSAEQKPTDSPLNDFFSKPVPLNDVLGIFDNRFLEIRQSSPNGVEQTIELQFEDIPIDPNSHNALLEQYPMPEIIDLTVSKLIPRTHYQFFVVYAKRTENETAENPFKTQTPTAKINWGNSENATNAASVTIESDSNAEPFLVSVEFDSNKFNGSPERGEKLEGMLELNFQQFAELPTRIPIVVWYNPCKTEPSDYAQGVSLYKSLVSCYESEIGAQRANFDLARTNSITQARQELFDRVKSKNISFVDLQRVQTVLMNFEGPEVKDFEVHARQKLQLNNKKIEPNPEEYLFYSAETKDQLNQLQNAGSPEAVQVTKAHEDFTWLLQELAPLASDNNFAIQIQQGIELNLLGKQKWLAWQKVLQDPFDENMRTDYAEESFAFNQKATEYGIIAQSSSDSPAANNPTTNFDNSFNSTPLDTTFSKRLNLELKYATSGIEGKTVFLTTPAWTEKSSFRLTNFERNNGESPSPAWIIENSDTIFVVSSAQEPLAVLRRFQKWGAGMQSVTEGRGIEFELLVFNPISKEMENKGTFKFWHNGNHIAIIPTGSGNTSAGQVTVDLDWKYRPNVGDYFLQAVSLSLDEKFQQTLKEQEQKKGTGIPTKQDYLLALDDFFGSNAQRIELLDERITALEAVEHELDSEYKQVNSLDGRDSYYFGAGVSQVMGVLYWPFEKFRKYTLGSKKQKEQAKPTYEETVFALQDQLDEIKTLKTGVKLVKKGLEKGKSMREISDDAFSYENSFNLNYGPIRVALQKDPVVRDLWREQAYWKYNPTPNWASIELLFNQQRALENESFELFSLELLAKQRFDELAGSESKDVELGLIGWMVKKIDSEEDAKELANLSFTKSIRQILEIQSGKEDEKLVALENRLIAERNGIEKILEKNREGNDLVSIQKSLDPTKKTLEQKTLAAAFENPTVDFLFKQEQQFLKGSPSQTILDEQHAKYLFDIAYRKTLVGEFSEASGYYWQITKNYPNSSVTSQANEYRKEAQRKELTTSANALLDTIFSVPFLYDFLAPAFAVKAVGSVVRATAEFRVPIQDIIRPLNVAEKSEQLRLMNIAQETRALPQIAGETKAVTSAQKANWFTQLAENQYLNAPWDDALPLAARNIRNARIAGRFGTTSEFVGQLATSAVRLSEAEAQFLNSIRYTARDLGNGFSLFDRGDAFLVTGKNGTALRFPKNATELSNTLKNAENAEDAFAWLKNHAQAGSLTAMDAAMGEEIASEVSYMARASLQELRTQQLLNGSSTIMVAPKTSLQISSETEAFGILQGAVFEPIPITAAESVPVLNSFGNALSEANNKVLEGIRSRTDRETTLQALQRIVEDGDSTTVLGFGSPMKIALPNGNTVQTISLFGDQTGLEGFVTEMYTIDPLIRNRGKTGLTQNAFLAFFQPPAGFQPVQEGEHLGISGSYNRRTNRITQQQFTSMDALKRELGWQLGKPTDGIPVSELLRLGRESSRLTIVHEAMHWFQLNALNDSLKWKRFKYYSQGLSNPELRVDAELYRKMQRLYDFEPQSPQIFEEMDARKTEQVEFLLLKREGKWEAAIQPPTYPLTDQDIDFFSRAGLLTQEQADYLKNLPEVTKTSFQPWFGKPTVVSELSRITFRVANSIKRVITKAECSCTVAITHDAKLILLNTDTSLPEGQIAQITGVPAQSLEATASTQSGERLVTIQINSNLKGKITGTPINSTFSELLAKGEVNSIAPISEFSVEGLNTKTRIRIEIIPQNQTGFSLRAGFFGAEKGTLVIWTAKPIYIQLSFTNPTPSAQTVVTAIRRVTPEEIASTNVLEGADYALSLNTTLPVKTAYLGRGQDSYYLTPDALRTNFFGDQTTVAAMTNRTRHELIHGIFDHLTPEAKQELMNAYMQSEPDYPRLFTTYPGCSSCTVSYSRLKNAEEQLRSVFGPDYSHPLNKKISFEQAQSMKPGEYVDIITDGKLARYVKIPEADYFYVHSDAPIEENFVEDKFLEISQPMNEYIAHNIDSGTPTQRLSTQFVQLLEKNGFFNPEITRVAQEITNTASQLPEYQSLFKTEPTAVSRPTMVLPAGVKEQITAIINRGNTVGQQFPLSGSTFVMKQLPFLMGTTPVYELQNTETGEKFIVKKDVPEFKPGRDRPEFANAPRTESQRAEEIPKELLETGHYNPILYYPSDRSFHITKSINGVEDNAIMEQFASPEQAATAFAELAELAIKNHVVLEDISLIEGHNVFFNKYTGKLMLFDQGAQYYDPNRGTEELTRKLAFDAWRRVAAADSSGNSLNYARDSSGKLIFTKRGMDRLRFAYAYMQDLAQRTGVSQVPLPKLIIVTQKIVMNNGKEFSYLDILDAPETLVPVPRTFSEFLDYAIARENVYLQFASQTDRPQEHFANGLKIKPEEAIALFEELKAKYP